MARPFTPPFSNLISETILIPLIHTPGLDVESRPEIESGSEQVRSPIPRLHGKNQAGYISATPGSLTFLQKEVIISDVQNMFKPFCSLRALYKYVE